MTTVDAVASYTTLTGAASDARPVFRCGGTSHGFVWLPPSVCSSRLIVLVYRGSAIAENRLECNGDVPFGAAERVDEHVDRVDALLAGGA